MNFHDKAYIPMRGHRAAVKPFGRNSVDAQLISVVDKLLPACTGDHIVRCTCSRSIRSAAMKMNGPCVQQDQICECQITNPSV